MNQVRQHHAPSDGELDELGVFSWPIWEKSPSTFPWTYDQEETCYLLDGHVTVTPEDGSAIEIRASDLVTFPAGMSCTWEIHEHVKKHYRFG